MGGEVAFLRIRNCSSQAVTVTLEDSRNIDDLPGEIGQLEAKGGTFPASSAGTTELKPGKFYHRLKGEPTRRFHKDGYVHIVAKSCVGDAPAERVRLAVDHDKWWTDRHDHSHGEQCVSAQGAVVLSVDVDDDDDEPSLKDAFRIEVRIYDAIPTAKWMGHMANVLAPKPLCEVAMPGTHDSATYKWNKELGASPDNDLTSTIQDKLEFGRGIIRKIGSAMTDGILSVVYARLCQCQDMTIRQQLDAGIRYLDLRVALAPNGSFYSCHGVYCVNFDEILNEIKEFLDANPKEMVLLDFNHFYGMEKEHHDQLAALVTSALGADKIATGPALSPTSTVQEYWDAGVQAVVIYHDVPTHQASDGKMWHKHNIVSPWPNKNKAAELRENLDGRIKRRNKSKFFVLQGILTPDGELIKNEILENKGGTSIRSIAGGVSNKVVNWIGDDWQQETHNVVIVDFFEECSMVPAIINLNK